MLPVTSHKSFHVPHSLATAAAIAALITALGWEDSGGDRPAVAPGPQAEVTGARIQRPGDEQPENDDAAARARAGTESCEAACDRNSLSELLPLVLPGLAEH